MIDKIVRTVADAVNGIQDGSTVMVAGFGGAGLPHELIDALCEQGARHLTIVANNAETGPRGVSRLLALGRVDKVICSFARSPADSNVFDTLYRERKIQLELVPQGTLCERIRAGGAGIGGFYTRTAVGTELETGKETRVLDGQTFVFERPLRADVSLIKAARADRWGNLAYHRAGRNFNPVMATAASMVVCQAREVVALGDIDPDEVVTPGIFVNRIVQI